ncbi:MAG: response regulator [Deltaproteobacteria bacterium]|nr:response regulator [Deltaproteobacteria bacterium]MBI2499983.1 response regulator [Deltaproteobacteria bacterium]
MGKRILVIDDERDLTELLGTLLDFHGIKADTVNDPLKVETMLEQTAYDLVVTDLMMPGLDGFELIQRIHHKEPRRSLPIIVLSAKSLTQAERKVLIQNKVHFFMKPFEPQNLVDQISGLLKE